MQAAYYKSSPLSHHGLGAEPWYPRSCNNSEYQQEDPAQKLNSKHNLSNVSFATRWLGEDG